jgi:Transglycosylase SLT domain
MTASVYTRTLRYSRRSSARVISMRRRAVIVCYGALALCGLFAANWVGQVLRKPGELLAPVSASFAKSAESTWRNYGRLFEEHSTNILSAEFLAALAQVESSGNPVARTPWRWQWSWNPLEIYRPASSALGMYQITDATFAEARKYCIRDHQVASDGRWHELNSCWFNGLYTRTIPSHATELTAAYLHRSIANTLARHRAANVRLAEKQRLAAVIHLCGKRRGESFVRRGFRTLPAERCGHHSLPQYLNNVELMKNRFARLRKTELL